MGTPHNGYSIKGSLSLEGHCYKKEEQRISIPRLYSSALTCKSNTYRGAGESRSLLGAHPISNNDSACEECKGHPRFTQGKFKRQSTSRSCRVSSQQQSRVPGVKHNKGSIPVVVAKRCISEQDSQMQLQMHMIFQIHSRLSYGVISLVLIRLC